MVPAKTNPEHDGGNRDCDRKKEEAHSHDRHAEPVVESVPQREKQAYQRKDPRYSNDACNSMLVYECHSVALHRWRHVGGLTLSER